MAISSKIVMVLALIIVVVAIVVLLGLSGNTKLPAGKPLANSNSGTNSSNALSVPATESSDYAMLSSKKSISMGTFFNYVTNTNSTNSTPISIVYTGSASGTYSVLSLNFPINLEYSKINNNWKVKANATSVPLFGNLTLYTMYNDGVLYSCSESTVYNNSGKSTSYKCTKETNNSVSGVSLNNLSNYNLVINNVKESSYKGIPCLYVSGDAKNVSTPSSSNSTIPSNYNANMNVSACIYTQHNLPLNLIINFTAVNKTNSNQKIAFLLKLNEVSMSTNVNSTYVNTLPGPVANSTGSFGNGGSNYNYTTSISQNYGAQSSCNTTEFVNLNNYLTCGNFKVEVVGMSSSKVANQFMVLNVYNNATGASVINGIGINLFENGTVTYQNEILHMANNGVFNVTQPGSVAMRIWVTPA